MKKIKNKKAKNKQIRNIIIVLILVIITCFIMTIAPNYKRADKNKTKFILDNKEVTKELNNDLLIEKDVVYIGIKDIKELIDENLYIDEEEIITSSDMHVAYISKTTNKMELNGVNIELENTLKQKNGEIYLPISNLETLYNIKINYISNRNTVIIESLNKEKNKANANNNISIKWKPTFFSKTVDKVKKGESLTIIEETGENWTKVITDNGEIGYVKNNKLSNLYNLRQNMEKESNDIQNYDLEEIDIKSLDNLKNTRNRKRWIEITIDNIIMDNKDGICFDFSDISEYKEEYYRILIEMAPRLREIGKKTAVKNNKIINQQDLIKIVDTIE